MTLASRIGTVFGRKQACGYSEKDRAAIAKLRRRMAVVLAFFLCTNPELLLPAANHHAGYRGIATVLAVIQGLSFAAILCLGWAIAMRTGDEYRRELMRRSLMWGLGITLAATCVVSYLQLVVGHDWQVPIVAVPACLVLTTVAAKLIVFRRANE
jgi:MFS family permease